MHGQISARIQEIKDDRTHGASWLARQALGALMAAAQMSEAKTNAQLLDELKSVARALIEARPSMASIANSVGRLVYDVAQQSEREADIGSLKAFAQSRGKELIKASEEAVAMIAQHVSELIGPGEKLFTCSYSATVCQALKVAREASKHFSVMIAESKSPSGRPYGVVAAEEIRSYGIAVETISDDTIRRNMARANKVIAGADSVLSDGSLINGTPSYELAVAAKENAIPFYALCEKSKFTPDLLRGRSYFDPEPELEAGFDRIPARLITGILTEEGMLRPEEVEHTIEDLSKYVESL